MLKYAIGTMAFGLTACGGEPTTSQRTEEAIARSQELLNRIDNEIAAAGPSEKWTISEARSLVTDDPAVTISTRSQLLDGPAGYQRAQLFARCRERELDVIVAWPRPLDGNRWATATVRIDDSDPFDVEVAIAGSGDAFGWWGEIEARSVIAQMAPSERMVVRAIAYDNAPMDAQFNIAGLSEHMAAIDAACPPSPPKPIAAKPPPPVAPPELTPSERRRAHASGKNE